METMVAKDTPGMLIVMVDEFPGRTTDARRLVRSDLIGIDLESPIMNNGQPALKVHRDRVGIMPSQQIYISRALSHCPLAYCYVSSRSNRL
jgi:hypothetical protein